MQFRFTSPPPESPSDHLHLGEIDGRTLSVRLEDRALIVDQYLASYEMAEALYTEIDRVLTGVFGEKWQRAFADVCRIDHRYLRQSEFLTNFLPPRIVSGIRELATSDVTPAIAPLLLALARSDARQITDRDVSLSIKLYRLLRE